MWNVHLHLKRTHDKDETESKEIEMLTVQNSWFVHSSIPFGSFSSVSKKLVGLLELDYVTYHAHIFMGNKNSKTYWPYLFKILSETARSVSLI